MLRFGDSANFSRTSAAICLVLGPVLLATAALLDPAWSDDSATYLSEVAASSGAYAASGVISTVGTILFLVGMLGVLRLMRRSKVSLGQVAAALLVFGMIGLSSGMAFNAIDIALAQAADRSAAVGVYDNQHPVLIAYWLTFFFAGVVLGSLLLAIALIRRRIVPIWSPVLLLLSTVLVFAVQGAILNALANLVLAAALLPLAMLIWRLTDEQWRQWELPVQPEQRQGAPAVP